MSTTIEVQSTSVAELTTDEVKQLRDCESIIEAGRRTFIVVGQALARIREARLYRGEFNTFDDYCQQRWGYSGRYGRMICDAVEVVDNIEKSGTRVPLPETEKQVRPLTTLPAEERSDAWSEAVSTAPDGKVTARHVGKVVERRQARDAVAGQCPHGGDHEPDDDGDCVKCREPGVTTRPVPGDVHADDHVVAAGEAIPKLVSRIRRDLKELHANLQVLTTVDRTAIPDVAHEAGRAKRSLRTFASGLTFALSAAQKARKGCGRAEAIPHTQQGAHT